MELKNFYEQMEMNTLSHWNKVDELFHGKIVGYRKVKVPKYLTIKVPVVSKDFDNDSEYGDGSFRGILISLKEVKLFRIGTTIEKQPIRRKEKGKTVSFSRYSSLKV